MSEAKQTIAQLADNACAMPWEDKAPFSARYAFKEAVTPELFAELLQALQCAYSVLILLDAEVKALGCNAKNVPEKARAAIAKATRSAS